MDIKDHKAAQERQAAKDEILNAAKEINSVKFDCKWILDIADKLGRLKVGEK